MTKTGRIYTFMLITMSIFLVSLLMFCSYFYATGIQNWLLHLVTAQFFYVPILVYLLFVSLVVGGLLTGLIAFFAHQRASKVESQLQLLVSGQYEAQELKTDGKAVNAANLEQTIENLRLKMVGLQQEIQGYSNRPQKVDGETKEEILEQERHRLARELHDSVSQQLFAAMMMLSAINSIAEKEHLSDKISQQLTTVEKVINEAQSEMRALLLHLRPVNLEGKSLKEGIQQLLRELQSKVHININAEIDDVHLPSGIEDNLFRIVQELLSNTLRHAKAKEIDVFLKKIDQTVLLRVVDDGIGFKMTGNENAGSYGLKNIQERTKSIGGVVKVISFPGQGTSAEIRVPLLKEQSKS
ncbi:two-component system, sensor histidine kinase [Lactobacillus selangorensis]|uniref:Sensor histidine kinase n=1 Tax=Lactobacillus selangorensis TaxID=81857 RepID=A0A0R2FZU1_9LACO|nr:sensor histidine kinase [Lactobacillus selangorensis]KRN29711.1 two-component system, sensor histidine kinase [Lactobacillus selangorensis]KRN33760.1 two-component system, sensor histidine kinase [Lactobacillus selangorensis]